MVGAFGENAEPIEDLQYQDVVGGPLLLQVDRAIDLIFTKYFQALIDYATGVPVQVSIYEDRIVIFNMGSWSKRVPTDERIYEKHESAPHNPKIADVFFRSGDVEAWGRGFLKIKAECKKVNASLPLIDAENGGVSSSAYGCEKYISMLRYGQYGQVGADGVWRNKENINNRSGDKSGDKKVTKRLKCSMIKFLHLWKREKSMGFGIYRDRRYKKKRSSCFNDFAIPSIL